MRICSSTCEQAHPLLNFPPASVNMDSFNSRRRKDKVVFVMGATGTGKSRLSIDLATRFPAEIINSDKMQIYQGLDIVTNKVTEEERRGIPHHLLGIINPDAEFTASDFRVRASVTVEKIIDRNRFPIIVGGSNSFIEALADDEELEFRSKYDCCFLWVDVKLPVLHSFVSNRVNQMVKAGLIDEVRRIFNPKAEYSQGIRRAIGVPELDSFLRAEVIGGDRKNQLRLLEDAIEKIKENNCKLACSQLKKIHRLRAKWGWDMRRLDATDAFLSTGDDASEAWESLVASPATMIASKFLYENDGVPNMCGGHSNATALTVPFLGTAVAAATL